MAKVAAIQIETSVVELAQRGDADAFDTIYRHYQPHIAGYLCRLVGSPEIAADLTQDVFVSAYRTIGRTRVDLNLKSWLYPIATNRAIPHHRWWRIRRWLPLDDRNTSGVVDTTTDAMVTRYAVREELSEAMARLPKDHLACFLLHVQDGFSYEEIGDMLRISSSTARVRAFRVRSALATALMTCQEDV